GSSFKPFVYTTAMMNGYTPKSVVVDAPINIGGWSPRNYGRSYRGPVTLTTALVKSINTIPVRLAQAIGRDKIIDTAKRMGIRSELKITRPLPLGVAEVSVIDMASSYSVFANGGMKATAYGVLQIRNTKGELIYDHSRDEPAPERVLPEETVAQMNSILTQVVSSGTGRRAIIEGVVAGGKTGTTQAYRDAWFIGFTGNFCAAVWLGNDDFTSTGRVTGGFLPAMTWNKLMRFAHANVELKPIPGIGADGDILVTRKSKNRISISLAPKSGPPTNFGGAIPLSLSQKSTEAIERIGQLLREAAGAETAGGTVDGDRADLDGNGAQFAGATKAQTTGSAAGAH
ncbi:MAG: penicillin-binding protein, partial [Hyphomicrobiales bacterium]|nr:penicillin-binding protein [Hyphomicrobiales bacterium]